MKVEKPEKRDPLTGKAIGCAIDVHRILGPGLLGSAYQRCLALEIGLLINFHQTRPIDGLKRFVP